LKRNFVLIYRSIQWKEIYLLVIFFILDGLTSPTFEDFEYFFLMNIIMLSKFMFAMKTLIVQISMVLGVFIYGIDRELEVRYALIINVFI